MSTGNDASEHRLPLFHPAPLDYGKDYANHLLEQYKLYVESANKISDRRSAANNFLLTLNTFLISSIGVASIAAGTGFLQFVIMLAGVLVSFVWFSLIAAYRNLNTAKFAVIHELEQQLPARLFAKEWEVAEHGRGQAYKPLTHIEQWVPAIFIVLYLALALFIWLGKPNPSTAPGLHRPIRTEAPSKQQTPQRKPNDQK